MNKISIILAAVLTSLMFGCATTPDVVLAPVGPEPSGPVRATGDGQLEVFSATRVRGDEADKVWINPVWQQHTDYYIYDQEGKKVEFVSNSVGHYATAPRPVSLPPGKYVVKAQAKDYFWVQVPVVIESGRTTRVHLDDQWTVPHDAPIAPLVCQPNGHPVGWRAGS